jgi:hypothetical protein
MKSLEERQAEREQRKADEAASRKVSGLEQPDDGDEAGDETKPKRGKKSGVTTLKDAGIEGGAGGSPGAGNGAGAGNPFGNS